MRAASARSSFPKARRGSRSTSRSRCCSKRARTRRRSTNSPRRPHRTMLRRPRQPRPRRRPASARKPSRRRRRRRNRLPRWVRSSGAMAGFSPVPWPAGWRSRPGSISPRSAAPGRRAVSSRRISTRRWRVRPGRLSSPRAPPRASRLCRAGCRSSPRSRCWRLPATRPTPRSRTAVCAGSSPAGSANRNRPSRITTCRSTA